MRLATLTDIGPWTHGTSDEADCESCDWSIGTDKPRVVEYAARRHAIETDHVVTQYRVWNRVVFRRESIKEGT